MQRMLKLSSLCLNAGSCLKCARAHSASVDFLFGSPPCRLGTREGSDRVSPYSPDSRHHAPRAHARHRHLHRSVEGRDRENRRHRRALKMSGHAESRISPFAGLAGVRPVRQSTTSAGRSCFMSSCRFGKRKGVSHVRLGLVPLCPAAIRCALMLACAVSIILFSGEACAIRRRRSVLKARAAFYPTVDRISAEAERPPPPGGLRIRFAHLLLRIEFDAELLDQLVLGLQKVDVALFARDDLLEQVLGDVVR